MWTPLNLIDWNKHCTPLATLREREESERGCTLLTALVDMARQVRPVS
jgi:hypothetical protein